MADRTYDVALLGATGFTGRQAVRAFARQLQGSGKRLAVCGRDSGRLQTLIDEHFPAGGARPGVVIADTGDARSLSDLAAQASVVLNLAGPYHATGDNVVAACIAEGAHYLDLSGETFWVRRLIAERHEAARAAGVRIMPTAGYEALPFDLATHWAARAVRERHGEPCAEVRIVVRFEGRRITRLSDAVSGGTAATLSVLLEHDTSDSVGNVGCLLPPGTANADLIARRNAIRWWPEYDADLRAVIAPTVPAPFIDPPVILRGVALTDDPSLFAPHFRYREGTHMGSLVPRPGKLSEVLPDAATIPLQWALAATLAAPLANLGAAVAGPLQFERDPLRRLLQAVMPAQGRGPSDAALDGMSWSFEVLATSAGGKRLRGRVHAPGHPGYRSTPEMAASVALALARGTLGRTPHAGVVTPAIGLGVEAVEALAAAGLRFEWLG